MNARTKVLGQLVRESLYVVDEAAVAEAIVVRAAARRAVPGLLSGAGAEPVARPVRSFRPHRGAPSFRLCAAGRR